MAFNDHQIVYQRGKNKYTGYLKSFDEGTGGRRGFNFWKPLLSWRDIIHTNWERQREESEEKLKLASRERSERLRTQPRKKTPRGGKWPNRKGSIRAGARPRTQGNCL